MAHLVAMLHDDETQLVLPPFPAYPVDAWWVGSGLYLVSLRSADRQLLGSRLVAADGLPIASVLASPGADRDARGQPAHTSCIRWPQTGVNRPSE